MNIIDTRGRYRFAHSRCTMDGRDMDAVERACERCERRRAEEEDERAERRIDNVLAAVALVALAAALLALAAFAWFHLRGRRDTFLDSLSRPGGRAAEPFQRSASAVVFNKETP